MNFFLLNSYLLCCGLLAAVPPSPPLFSLKHQISGAFHPFKNPDPVGEPAATPTPSPTPSATPMDHVADANARLSIDPTDKTAGYRVIQDDGPTTYEFQGDGDDRDAGLWVTGAGTTQCNAPYIFNGTDTYTKIGAAATCHTRGLGAAPDQWTFDDDTLYRGSDTVSYAWETTTWTKLAGASNPVPVVARNPIASETNWVVIP